MSDRAASQQPAPSILGRGVAALLLGLVGVFVMVLLGWWTMGLGFLVAAVVVAPRESIRGAAGERGDAGPSI